MAVLGIDPGSKGALALVGSDGSLVEIWDMPMENKHVQPTGFGWILKHLPHEIIEPEHVIRAVCLEKVHAMPNQGVSSSFNFGASWGAVRGIFASQFPLEDVRPVDWKRGMGIRTAPKGLTSTQKKRHQEDEAFRVVRSLWPDHAYFFERRKDAGRAEAACIAEYGRRRRHELGLPC